MSDDGCHSKGSHQRDMRHGKQHAARVGHTSFHSVYGDICPEKRNVVGRVNHYPYVGMDGIVWRHGCRMYIHARNRCHVGVRQ